MDDDKSLDLSLGLQLCHGGVDSVKGKSIGPSDEADRDVKLINDFKNFLEGGTVKHDPSLGSQINGPVKTEDNFFNNLSQAPADAYSSKGTNGSGSRGASESRPTEVKDLKGADVGEKRKNLFGEVSQPKKLEGEAHRSDLQDKTIVSHISITTDEGSTADNEDVADSEAVGSTSRLTYRDEELKKRQGSAAPGPSEIHKEVHQICDSSTSSAELEGQRIFTISAEKEVNIGSMSNVRSFPTQTGSMMNISYSIPEKDSHAAGTSSTSNYQLPAMMRMMAASNNERGGSQKTIPANMPLMFGYSTVQLPNLDKDNFPTGASIQQQFQPSYGGNGHIGSEMHNDIIKIAQASAPAILSESPQSDARGGDKARGTGTQNITFKSSTSCMENDAKGNNMIFRSAASDQPRPGSIPSEYPDIKPGIAADVKFGGSGSSPNLPWVSTTGPGPNGKTISGVTYRFNPTQIKIVCACHGFHMSPEEFVRHASEGQTHPDAPDAGISASTVRSSNPAASTRS